MKSNISPQVISGTQNALIEINNLVRNGKYSNKRCREILEANGAHTATMTFAVKAGLFDRPTPGAYKSNLASIDPIHARKVVEARYEKQKSYNKRMTTAEITPVEKPTPIKKERKAFVFKPYKKREVKTSRTVSILWGLLKVSY